MDWPILLWANDLKTFFLDRARLGALGLEFYREGDSRTTDRGRKHIRTTIRGVEVTHPLSADTENVPLLPEPETNTALCAWGHHRPRYVDFPAYLRSRTDPHILVQLTTTPELYLKAQTNTSLVGYLSPRVSMLLAHLFTQALADKRQLKASACSSQIAELAGRRRAKRAM